MGQWSGEDAVDMGNGMATTAAVRSRAGQIGMGDSSWRRKKGKAGRLGLRPAQKEVGSGDLRADRGKRGKEIEKGSGTTRFFKYLVLFYFLTLFKLQFLIFIDLN